MKTWILFSSGVDSILHLKIWKDFGQFTGFICHGNDTCKTNRVKVAISNILYKKIHLHCKYVQWNYSGSTLKKLYFWKNSVFYCWPFFIVIFKNSKILVLALISRQSILHWIECLYLKFTLFSRIQQKKTVKIQEKNCKLTLSYLD